VTHEVETIRLKVPRLAETFEEMRKRHFLEGFGFAAGMIEEKRLPEFARQQLKFVLAGMSDSNFRNGLVAGWASAFGEELFVRIPS